MEQSYLIMVRFPCTLFKVARFTPLLKGQIRAPPSLHWVDLRLPLLPLPLGKAQLLLMSPNFLRHYLLTIWSLNIPTLTLSLDHLFLTWIGWWLWWRVYMSAFLNLLISCILTIIMFSFALLLLRNSWMRFSASLRQTFSYSCQKGREILIVNNVNILNTP